MDDRLGLLEKNVNAEFELFRDDLISNFTKEEIFDKAYKINFYQQIQDYLSYVCNGDSEGIFINDEIDILLNCGENLIFNLYDEYVDKEHSRIGSYKECEYLVRDFIENEMQHI